MWNRRVPTASAATSGAGNPRSQRESANAQGVSVREVSAGCVTVASLERDPDPMDSRGA